MSLVAYESSDETSEDEVIPDTNVNQNKFENKITNTLINEETNSSKNSNMNANLPNAKNKPISVTIMDEKTSNDDIAGSGLRFGALPKPKHFQNEYRFFTEEDDVPLFKPKQPVAEIPTKREKAPARISIPSLSEFKDVDEELEQSKKKPTASKQGTGLFAILPPPKNEIITKKNNLIPHVLTKTTSTAVSRSSVTKVPIVKTEKSSGRKVDERAERALPMMDYDSNSEDDEKEHVDFFSLSKPSVLPEVTVPSSINLFTIAKNNGVFEESIVADNKGTMANIINDSQTTKTVVAMENDRKQNSTLVSTVMNLPREEILLKNKAEVGPKLPIPEQEFNVDSEGNVAFDEKAIEYLCGKRGVKRKTKMIEEANIIEINGEDIKPDEREWLVKAMTEEPVQRPVSMQGAGPSSQSKKKHQITYLAHQAKAMEVELKNSWSQNRMARKQTQSKYGF